MPTRPLDGDASADVVVIGGGYLGLWTAWHLLELEPSLDVLVLEASVCGHGPSGRNGGFCETLWGDAPTLRERSGDAAALAVCRASEDAVRGIGEWCAANGVDAWYQRRSDAAGGDDPVSGRGLGSLGPCGWRAGRAGRGLAGERRAGACALRLAPLPRRRALPPERDRPARPARARAAGEAARARRPDPRAHRGAAAQARGRRGDPSRPGERGLDRARGEHGCSGVLGVPALARGRLQPHRPDRAGPGGARGARLDGRGGDRRQPDTRALHADDEGRAHRVRLGRGEDGERRPPHAPARGRSRRRRPRPREPRPVLPAAPRACDHPRLGRPDRRLPHAPADLRQPWPRAPRLRLHGQRGRALVSRRRDPRPARSRPPRRADVACDRRAWPQALPARAAALRGRVRDPARAGREGRGRGRRPRAGRRSPRWSPRSRAGSGSGSRR